MSSTSKKATPAHKSTPYPRRERSATMPSTIKKDTVPTSVAKLSSVAPSTISMAVTASMATSSMSTATVSMAATASMTTPSMASTVSMAPTTGQKNAELIAKLQAIVKDLVSKLAHTRFENAQLEANIREEVYDGYVKLHKELKESISTDKHEAIADIEELADFRMQLFKDNYVNNCQMSDGTDDSAITENSLALASKLNDMESKFEAKNTECEELRKEIERLNCQIIELKEAYMKINDDLIFWKKQSVAKDRQITDLNEVLEEAGETFRKMEREKEQYLATIAALKSEKTTNAGGVQLSPTTAERGLNSPKYKPMSTDSGVRNSSNIRQGTQALLTDVEDSSNESINGANDIQTLVHEHVDQFVNFGLGENQFGVDSSIVDQGDRMDEQLDGDLDIEFDIVSEKETDEQVHRDSPRRSSEKKRRSSKRVSMSVNSIRQAYSKRLSQVVSLNRAYKLRRANTPSMGHNHASGVSYKIRSSKKSPPPNVKFEDTVPTIFSAMTGDKN